MNNKRTRCNLRPLDIMSEISRFFRVERAINPQFTDDMFSPEEVRKLVREIIL